MVHQLCGAQMQDRVNFANSLSVCACVYTRRPYIIERTFTFRWQLYLMGRKEAERHNLAIIHTNLAVPNGRNPSADVEAAAAVVRRIYRLSPTDILEGVGFFGKAL